MKRSNTLQSMGSYTIRRNLKRMVAMAMTVLMVTSVIGDSGLSYVNAQPQNDSKTITMFAILGEGIQNQQVIKGSSEEDLILPDTLEVTVKSIVQENPEITGETIESHTENSPEVTQNTNAEDETVTNADENTETDEEISTETNNQTNNETNIETTQSAENTEVVEENSETNQKEIAETVRVESSENYAMPPTQEVKSVTQGITQADTTSEAETNVTTREVYENVSLENITWEINTASSASELFDSTNAGAVYLYEPILPEGYTIAEGIILPQIKVEIVEEVVSNLSFQESKTVDGIEITVMADPGVFPEGSILNVKKIEDTNIQEKIEEAVTEEVQAEAKTKTVEELISFDITITDADGNELQPETSKGEVKVSFAQLPMVTEDTAPTQQLKIFHMDDSLSEATGLETIVNQEAESVEATAEHFSVYTVAQLTAEIRENVEVEIKAADGTLTYYDTIEEAITAAQSLSGCTVTLLKDVATEDAVTATSGTFILDLNGKAWTNTYSTGSGVLQLNGSSGNTASLTVKDSVGGGSITTTASGVYSIFGYTYYSLSLEGGSYTGIWSYVGNIADVLADGYVYRNNSNGTVVTDTSGTTISNVTVGEAPVKIIAQPEDAVAEPNYSVSPTFSVAATTVPVGSGKTITYKWYKNGTEISGANNESYTVDPGLTEGSYTYYCAVTCDGYTVKSENAVLYVNSNTGDFEVTDSNAHTSKYPILEAAITAATSKPNSTVKLLADATTASQVKASSGTFTIDLNGHTWTSTASDTAVFFQYGNVTFKDSGSGGKFTTNTATCLINVRYGSATFDGGIYENTKEIVLMASTNGTMEKVTIKNGTFIGNAEYKELLYFMRINVSISNGSFDGNPVYLYNCQSVSLTGGIYDSIQMNSGSVDTLLEDNYAYKQSGTWINNPSGTSLSNVTVQLQPVAITAQPQNAANATYGYTSAPTISVSAETTATATGDITYQWYRVKSGDETSDTATSATQTLPTGLDTGTHSFYCVVTCDGYILNSQSATFTVEPKNIAEVESMLIIPDGGYTYDGTEKKPPVALALDGHALDLGTDYILDYMDNTDAGYASVAITGQGNFTGTKCESFYIKKATPNISLEIKGAGADDEIMYGSAVTYTVHVTGVGGVALTDATIVAVNCINGGNPIGYVKEYNTEKGAYIISQSNFNSEKPDTYPFFATAVFPVGSDTYKNYVLGENREIKSAEISKSVQKADTSIAFNSSYAENYYYTGSPISNPTAADLSITGASFGDVVFEWNSIYGETLSGPPTDPGTYVLLAVIKGTDYIKQSTVIKNGITISYFDGVVTTAYNGSTTKPAWYSSDVSITAEGYTVSDSLNGTYSDFYLLSAEGEVSKTLYFKQKGTGYITDGKDIAVKVDKTTPVFSGEGNGIKIDTNHWKTFLNTITFGKFFNATKNVSISATDSISGISKYYYFVDTTGSTTIKTAEELNSVSFTEGNSFSIEDDNKYVIYAYAVDVAGNKSPYICTDGIVLDKTAPILSIFEVADYNIKETEVFVGMTANEPCTVHYVISDTPMAGVTVSDIALASDKRSFTIAENMVNRYPTSVVNGLSTGTTYYLYGFAEDMTGNVTEVKSDSFTTAKIYPYFNANPQMKGVYGQKVSEMTIIAPESINGAEGTWSVTGDGTSDVPGTDVSRYYFLVFTPADMDKYRIPSSYPVIPNVMPKSLTDVGVTIGEVPGTYIYDETAKEPTVTVVDSTATIMTSDYDYSYSNNINAGTATVTITGKGNYTGSVNRTFTIDKAPAPSIIYPVASNITYGQKLSASSLSFSSTEYGTFAWTSGNVVPSVTNGGYEVTFTPNAKTTANYETISGTTHTVDVTVSKATPGVTVNTAISGDVGSRKATLTATVTGAGNGETPTGTVKFVNSTSGSDEEIAGATAVKMTDGKATYTWTGLASQIYKVKAVYSGSGNYNTTTSTELSFDTNKQNQAALSIGNIGKKTYGDGTFTLSATGGSGGGAVTFESSDPTIVSISGTTATIHKAGTVTITATKATDSTYNEATASLSLTVGKKALTIKANDQLNMIKGAAMPTLTYIATGLVGSDTFTSPTLSTTATDTNTIGEYDITISGGTLANADSYAVTYTNGKLTVVNATYTVTVTNGTGSGSYSEGQTVTISAESRNGYTFSGWSSSDGVIFANSTASTTTFAMLGKAVTVTANYIKTSNGDSGDSNGGTTASTTVNTNRNNNIVHTTPIQTNTKEALADADNTPNTGDTPQNSPTQQNQNNSQSQTAQPYLVGQEGKSGWAAIMTEMEVTSEEAGEGLPAMTVQMNGATTIPAEVLVQLRGKNRNLVLDMGDGITWTINGMDISETQLVDINLGVTRNTNVIPKDLVNGIRGDNDSIQIELVHNGAFGFGATLTIAFDEADAGKYANLFYFNEETGELEYMESAKVGEDGTAMLSFVHASAYTIVLSDETMDESTIASTTDTTNQTQNTDTSVINEVQATEETLGSIIIIWLILGIISIVVIAGTTIYIKRQKSEIEDYEG